MRQLTIAQRRERQLQEFNNKYINNEETARKIFNSYYRYVGLYRRLVDLENDSRYCDSRYCKSLQAKEETWRERLTGYLKPYNVVIFVPWITPCLGIKDESNGAIKENVIDPILY